MSRKKLSQKEHVVSILIPFGFACWWLYSGRVAGKHDVISYSGDPFMYWLMVAIAIGGLGYSLYRWWKSLQDENA